MWWGSNNEVAFVQSEDKCSRLNRSGNPRLPLAARILVKVAFLIEVIIITRILSHSS